MISDNAKKCETKLMYAVQLFHDIYGKGPENLLVNFEGYQWLRYIIKSKYSIPIYSYDEKCSIKTWNQMNVIFNPKQNDIFSLDDKLVVNYDD